MDELFHGIVIGLHLVSAHVPDDQYMHNSNPGIYFRTESGWTAGVYRNSLQRTSVYGGFTFTTDVVEALPLSLTVGAVSGYQRGKAYVECPKNVVVTSADGARCYRIEGYSSHAVSFLLAPSVSFPAAERWIGAVPRLSYMPRLGAGNNASVFHLSVEKAF